MSLSMVIAHAMNSAELRQGATQANRGDLAVDSLKAVLTELPAQKRSPVRSNNTPGGGSPLLDHDL